MISKKEIGRYFDILQKEKKLLPGPDKYNHHRPTFNDPKKKSLIYT